MPFPSGPRSDGPLARERSHAHARSGEDEDPSHPIVSVVVARGDAVDRARGVRAAIPEFQNRPALAPELLRHALGVTLPEYGVACVEAADLSDVNPTDGRVDLVVLLVEGKPVLTIVWRCSFSLSRASGSRGWRTSRVCERGSSVRRACWSSRRARRWPTGRGPRSRSALGRVWCRSWGGPQAVPVARDLDAARCDPELPVLSALAHGKEEADPEVALAALRAARGLDEDCLIRASLNGAAHATMEELMASRNYVDARRWTSSWRFGNDDLTPPLRLVDKRPFFESGSERLDVHR